MTLLHVQHGVRRTAIAAAALALIPSLAAAQNSPEVAAIPPAAQQIAAAVLSAPESMRASAAVWGYAPDGKMVKLREGTGPLVCLASNPRSPRFHVACYHKSLEPFMARGRELRAQGHDADVDSIRFREIQEEKLPMPRLGTMLYSLTGGRFDPETGTAPDARWLYVVYVPFATPESMGLSARPQAGTPWLMFPGTPKAHIMFTPDMSRRLTDA